MLVRYAVPTKGSVTVIFSVSLSVASAAFCHIGVRHLEGSQRLWLLLLSATALGSSLLMGDALGGFWPGAYTLLSVFFLACIAMPWADLALKHYHAD